MEIGRPFRRKSEVEELVEACPNAADRYFYALPIDRLARERLETFAFHVPAHVPSCAHFIIM